MEGGDVDGGGAGVGEGDGLRVGGVAYLGGGEGERALREGVGDEGALLVGAETERGAAEPVRLMRSGALRASLSMMRVPVSLVGRGEVVPVGTWLVGV